jgi:hypothetical protein
MGQSKEGWEKTTSVFYEHPKASRAAAFYQSRMKKTRK